MLPPELRMKIEAAVNARSRGDYAGALSAVDTSSRPASDLKAVVDQYGQTLLPPPPGQTWNVVAFVPPAPDGWSIWVPLWSVEEGRSDLELRFTAVRQVGRIEVELEDLRVP